MKSGSSRSLKDAAHLEDELHFVFRDKREVGEWFRVDWETVVKQAELRLDGKEYSEEYCHPDHKRAA
jgi:hypothetical protein